MSGIRSLYRGAAAKGYASAASAPLRVDSSTNTVKLIVAGSGTTEVEQADVSTAQTFTNKTLTAPVITGLKVPVVSGLVAGPTAITAAQSGSTFLLDRAAGGELTLPVPVAGLNYTFVVTVSVTSNDYEIATDNPGTSVFIGSLWETVAAGTGTEFFPGATDSAIVMAGTTNGGLKNTVITVVALNGTQWVVDGTVFASGTIITPFAAS